jgi:transposase-like protein
MKPKHNPFKWKQFRSEIILLCVRWYLRYSLTYRDVTEIMEERGLKMAHTTIMRWVHEYSPELDKRTRPHLQKTGDSWRVDETYIKIKGKWNYLYRAVDKEGDTIDFYLSVHRDQLAAARFFKKALGADHNEVPRVINVDKNPSYPPAVDSAKKAGYLPDETELRQVKFLNNGVESDHRRIKRLISHGLGFKGFWTAHKTIRGYETMHMIRKGQVALPHGSHMEQVKFIEEIFGVAA